MKTLLTSHQYVNLQNYACINAWKKPLFMTTVTLNDKNSHRNILTVQTETVQCYIHNLNTTLLFEFHRTMVKCKNSQTQSQTTHEVRDSLA